MQALLLCRTPSLYTIKALFILDSDGQRLLAKYYDGTFPSPREQAAFERKVFSKTRGDVACLQGLTVVRASSADLLFYVVGSCQENEVSPRRRRGAPRGPPRRRQRHPPPSWQLLLVAVLGCLVEALGRVLR
uniref:Coatomer subunit zeta n=1 Tax=Apteryx owenii TaxID=8824 RepID=A0A8B9PRM1_APTOW